MGVISTAKRTVQATAVLAVLAFVGFHVLTKLDTSKDRQATVIVKLGSSAQRTILGNVFTFINEAERSVDSISDKEPEFTETFWLRPGEKVRVWAYLSFGKATLSCQILLDGVPAGPPRVSREDFEASCETTAVG